VTFQGNIEVGLHKTGVGLPTLFSFLSNAFTDSPFLCDFSREHWSRVT